MKVMGTMKTGKKDELFPFILWPIVRGSHLALFFLQWGLVVLRKRKLRKRKEGKRRSVSRRLFYDGAWVLSQTTRSSGDSGSCTLGHRMLRVRPAARSGGEGNAHAVAPEITPTWWRKLLVTQFFFFFGRE